MKAAFSVNHNPKVFGIRQALSNAGDSTAVWENTPLYDVIADINPDVVFVSDKDYCKDKSVRLAKEEFPHIKFVLLQETPISNIEGIDLTLKLHDYLPEIDKQIFVPYMTNSVYKDGKPFTIYQSDITVITNSVDPNDTSKIQLINQLGSQFRLKVYGNIRIPSVHYLGAPEISEYKNVIKSASHLLMFDNELLYAAAVNNVSPVVMTKNPKEAWEAIDRDGVCRICTSQTGWLEDLKAKAISDTYDLFVKQMKEHLGI